MAYKKGTSKNVIVGAAAFFISETSGDITELPPGASSASGTRAVEALSSTTGWRNAGYTSDGVEVSYEPDYGEVEVDQELDSVQMFKQGMSVSVNTTLSEATLYNLMIAWGQTDSTITDKTVEGDNGNNRLKITGGELHDDPVERSLAFVGKAPRPAEGKSERVYHLRRALQVESSSHSLSRADATTIPVSFRCLPDSGAPSSSGDYGVIIQRTVT